jgi:hypothetical protein
LRKLNLKVAGGEQDSSQWQWKEIVDQRMVDIVQRDVFYRGGFVDRYASRRWPKSRTPGDTTKSESASLRRVEPAPL